MRSQLELADQAWAGMLYHYRKLQVKDPQGEGKHAMDTCCAVGKAVEESWKIAYRPKLGMAPIPLACQTAADLKIVEMHDVWVEGRKCKSVKVKLPYLEAVAITFLPDTIENFILANVCI